MVKKYVKKPVVIEAVIWEPINYNEVCQFVGKALETEGVLLKIDTLEGIMYAAPGDYIIKGVKGEFYPCKPDIFGQTYEEVD